MKTFSISRFHRRIITKAAKSPDKRYRITDRQERISGLEQPRLRQGNVKIVGNGGLGGLVVWALARQGIKRLGLFDNDYVDPTNCNRQLFFERDFFKPKAFCLARNVAPFATCRTTIDAYRLSFQDALAVDCKLLLGDAVFVGVDNGETRRDTSIFYRSCNVPCIFAAVDRHAQQAWVFVQEPGQACLGCQFPRSLVSAKAPCLVPASVEPLMVVGGFVTYAIHSLLMPGRKRGWNYRYFSLTGFAPSIEMFVPRNPECPLCRND